MKNISHKWTSSVHKGFTVLEFLVVMIIMAILIGLILVGLTAARANGRDQSRISNLHTIAVGLEQYKDICREYPADLISGESCLDLAPATLGSLVANIDDYNFNQSSTAEYQYVPIAPDGVSTDVCSGYHLYVRLETDHDAFTGAKFDSSSSTVTPCIGQTLRTGINAFSTAKIFDLHK